MAADADERGAPSGAGAALSGAGRRKDRPLEWFLAGFSFLWGAAALVFAEPVAGTVSGGGVAMALGAAHMTALLINGSMWWTPALRLATTALSAGYFSWSAAALATTAAITSSSLCAYVAFGFFWCAYAAGVDVARMRLGSYGD
jgi:hypothetical protein